jgi:hypothetical protein
VGGGVLSGILTLSEIVVNEGESIQSCLIANQGRWRNLILFLIELELVDMSLIGRRFTWLHPNGVTMSRLDRVLLSTDWMLKWTNPNVWALSRDVSDHCPLVVQYNSSEWGMKPFQFNNFWLQHKSIKYVVVQHWDGYACSGWMGFVIKDRLKNLKICLKSWSAENVRET